MSEQQALTGQLAASEANANQTAVNADVPVAIGAGDVLGGNDSANQLAANGALSGAGNDAGTSQMGGKSQNSS